MIFSNWLCNVAALRAMCIWLKISCSRPRLRGFRTAASHRPFPTASNALLLHVADIHIFSISSFSSCLSLRGFGFVPTATAHHRHQAHETHVADHRLQSCARPGPGPGR
eukprot:16200454-Heterocapsa_arctica.AAC.1